MKFTDRGSLYTTNVTFGEVDTDIVWQPNNVSASMMECPDLFPLGGNNTWVLLGSLYKTNQWWVGTLSGNPPRFTPQRVGILDYGQGYAAKTGSTMVQGPGTRRVMFSFTGWQAPTNAPGCGRIVVMPRELGVRGSTLTIAPVNETALLRIPGSVVRLTTVGEPTAKGSQIEVRMTCTGMRVAFSSGATGKVGVRTLATADGKAYTEIGYDMNKQVLYADHTHCCAASNAIVQRAPLRVGDMASGGDSLEISLFVDGGLIESFAANLVAITTLVSPDERTATPFERTTTTFSEISTLKCTTESYMLSYSQNNATV
jgi:sucrose-6-phosphate hydrolase SacC (GH32 family)